MGAHLLQALDQDSGTQLVGALDAPGHPRLGEEVAPGVRLVSDPSEALDRAQVVIDFSVPEMTMRLLDLAPGGGIAGVIGTTGFSPDQRNRIDEQARKMPIVLAANFSIGITLLLEVAAELARRLRTYQVEILELHHAAKADAPSGTALRLAESVAEARGLELPDQQVLHREGKTGPRPPDAIGIQSLRAGDAVGDHTVFFAGPGERLELTHRALSRENFASGAVRAALWVSGRSAGLYSMREVLSGIPPSSPARTGAA
jgi:4-hydroxy-tetrahydrodipicolinate reductase